MNQITRDEFVEHPRAYLSPVNDVEVRVVRLDSESKKLQLTMLPENILEEENVLNKHEVNEDEDDRIQLDEIEVDDELWGEIRRVTDYGAYVEIGTFVERMGENERNESSLVRRDEPLPIRVFRAPIRRYLIFCIHLIHPPYSPRRGVSRFFTLHGPSRIRGGQGAASQGVYARWGQGESLGDGRGEDAEEDKADRQSSGRFARTEEGGSVDLRMKNGDWGGSTHGRCVGFWAGMLT